jgi:hypothetical protein
VGFAKENECARNRPNERHVKFLLIFALCVSTKCVILTRLESKYDCSVCMFHVPISFNGFQLHHLLRLYTKTSGASFISLYLKLKNRDILVSIALGYGLDDRGYRVRFPAAAGNFSFHHRVQNGSGAHSATYPMGIRGLFPGGKAAGA